MWYAGVCGAKLGRKSALTPPPRSERFFLCRLREDLHTGSELEPWECRFRCPNRFLASNSPRQFKAQLEV